jgi:hypothetical protein
VEKSSPKIWDIYEKFNKISQSKHFSIWLTHDPLFLDVGVPGLEGVGLRLGLALDGEVEAARVQPGHLLVLLPDRALDVGQDLGREGRRQPLRLKKTGRKHC